MKSESSSCCGTGGRKQSCAPESAAAGSENSGAASDIKKLVDHKVQLLIAAGAAMAANCEPCLTKIVADLKQAGVGDADIRSAVKIGQFVKERPAELMKGLADRLTGSHLSSGVAFTCPSDHLQADETIQA